MITRVEGLMPDEVLNAVAETESRAGDGPSSRRVYRQLGAWLVAQRHLWRMLVQRSCEAPFGLLPGFRDPLTLRQRLSRGKRCLTSPRLSAASGASCVQIKNNVRAFYLDTPNPCTAKLVMGNVRTLKDMSNEVDARQRVEASGVVRLPRLLHVDLTGTPPFFREQFILGRKPDGKRDADILLRDLFPSLCRMYERAGIAIIPVRDLVAVDEVCNLLAGASESLSWEARWGDRDEFILRASQLLTSSAGMPISMGHGDLSLGNTLITRFGEVYIIDWELARELPIACDFLKLASVVPGAYEYTLAWMHGTVLTGFPRNAVLTHREQLAVAALLRLLRWSDALRVSQAKNKREGRFETKMASRISLAVSLLRDERIIGSASSRCCGRAPPIPLLNDAKQT